ncbi:GlsB/YeaQ/YmgE family stress response membrane protein [Bombilactobacillus folatiphilus]|uniref:GlsB/YeaQ/YmgE family stress response membrane protein n=1 Tax=Bombilactobacillus folatiphilus TaxID=2923362 RepID=A0ABY4P9V9_9LACO|nr:GlsB/YeaQ/YmgE family stress response membrane protein [Bombilactobacillus folatiphilus]UQS82528.1 GlsB/YeaQ/YmgE family stress response membrane protein [Bombilactobacillus folatiphilus]
MHWIWVLIVGALIGLLAGTLTKQNGSMGCVTNIIAGLLGSALGEWLFGFWGPQLAGMALVPSILGAVVLVLIVSFIVAKIN